MAAARRSTAREGDRTTPTGGGYGVPPLSERGQGKGGGGGTSNTCVSVCARDTEGADNFHNAPRAPDTARGRRRKRRRARNRSNGGANNVPTMAVTMAGLWHLCGTSDLPSGLSLSTSFDHRGGVDGITFLFFLKDVFRGEQNATVQI